MLINTVTWGIAPVVIKYYIADIPAVIMLFYRFVLATFFLYIIFAIINIKVDWQYWLKNWFLTLLAFLQNAIVLLFLFYGIEYTTAGFGAVVSAILPVLSSVLGVFILKEKIEKHERIGMLLAMIAFVGLSYISLGSVNISSSLYGALLITIGNLVFLFTVFAIKKYEQTHGLIKNFSWQFNFIGFLTSMLFLGVLAKLMHPGLITLSNSVLYLSNPGILYLAIFSSIAGLIAYVAALEVLEASEVMYYIYLQPIIALPASYIFLGEPFSWQLFLIFTIINLIGFYINIKGFKKHV